MLVPRLIHVILYVSISSPFSFFIDAVLSVSPWKRVSDGDFFNVTEGGGEWLDSDNGILGEPLNVKYSSMTVPIMMSDRR